MVQEGLCMLHVQFVLVALVFQQGYVSSIRNTSDAI